MSEDSIVEIGARALIDVHTVGRLASARRRVDRVLAAYREKGLEMRPKAERDRLLYALRGGNAINDNPTLLRFIADRLVNRHGENPHTDFIHALRERASMIEAALAAAKEPTDV